MSFRDDILAGLRASEDSAFGDMTPEALLDAYRDEVLREAADGLADQEAVVQYAVRTTNGSVFALDTDREAVKAFMFVNRRHLPEPVLVSRPLAPVGDWTPVEGGDA